MKLRRVKVGGEGQSQTFLSKGTFKKSQLLPYYNDDDDDGGGGKD